MNKTPQDPESPWRDRPLGNRAPEDRAAALLHSSFPARSPEDLVLARIEHDLLAEPERRRRSPLFFRLAITLVILFLGAASVGSYEYARRAGWIGTGTPSEARPAPLTEGTMAPPTPAAARPDLQAVPPPPAPGASPQRIAMGEGPGHPTTPPRGSTPLALPPHATAEAPSEAKPAQGKLAVVSPNDRDVPRREQGDSTLQTPPAIAPIAAATLHPGKTGPNRSPKLHASPPSISPAAEEARALDQALTLLRREHNAKAALVALDGYLGRYPSGVLNHEARTARIDALLLLGRSDEALIALEGLSFDGRRRANELQVIRAELRSRVNCTSAVADFTAALVNSRDAHLLERIFYGRGTCRDKLGDKHGAAQDLRLYLQRFPLGVHATWAREWLAVFEGNSKSRR